MKRSAFTFRREWKTMLAALPPEARAEVLLAVVNYSLGDDVAELSSSALTMFCLLKPLLDKEAKLSEKRREAGLKGLSSRYGKQFCNSKTVANSSKTVANSSKTV